MTAVAGRAASNFYLMEVYIVRIDDCNTLHMPLELDTKCVLLGGPSGELIRATDGNTIHTVHGLWPYNCCTLATVLTGRLMGQRLESLKVPFQESGDFLLEDAILDATLVLFAPLK